MSKCNDIHTPFILSGGLVLATLIFWSIHRPTRWQRVLELLVVLEAWQLAPDGVTYSTAAPSDFGSLRTPKGVQNLQRGSFFFLQGQLPFHDTSFWQQKFGFLQADGGKHQPLVLAKVSEFQEILRLWGVWCVTFARLPILLQLPPLNSRCQSLQVWHTDSQSFEGREQFS